MTIVAFDSKKFWRFRKEWVEGETKEKMTMAFTSQLGMGVTLPEPERFAERYVDASRRLAEEFELDYSTPFFSSTCLKDHLSIFRTVAFAERLVSEVHDLIGAVHCSFIALPVSQMPYVETGGIMCPKRRVPSVRFIESLGSAFSYLTALSYVWIHENADYGDLEMHIDAFTSKQTLAWDTLTKKSSVKVFYRGDECNPFISCADIVAFLVDSRLATRGLRLNPDNVKRVLERHSFDTTIRYFDQKSLDFYVWKEDRMINMSRCLKRPVVFLSMDRLNAGDSGLEHVGQGGQVEGKQGKPDAGIRQTEVYQAALKHAYRRNGCMKIFSPAEDVGLVRSGDMFIHVGPNSEKIGRLLRDTADIQICSGLEAVRSFEKSHNSIGS